MDDGLIITHIDQFIEPEPMVLPRMKLVKNPFSQTSAAPFLLVLDNEPPIKQNNVITFDESDFVPNLE